MRVKEQKLQRVLTWALLHFGCLVIFACSQIRPMVDVLARPAVEVTDAFPRMFSFRPDQFTNYLLLYFLNSLLWGIWLEDTMTRLLRRRQRIG